MKSLSLKILGCAAAMALLTTSRAQTYDDGQGQMVPQPNNGATDNGNGPGQEQTGPNGSTQPSQPNVVLVPVQVPTDLQNTNFQVMPPDQAQQQQPPQGGGPNPNQTFRVLPPMGGGQNQYRNSDRRNRWERRGEMAQQRQSANTDPSAYVPPANAGTNGTDGIMLNFHGAPIDEVLNYLSDAAGFIIELDTHVSGNIDVWSARPVSKDEAVQILNSVLNREGFAAVRNGRTLRIMTHDNAIHSMIPVIEGGDPNTIPDTDEIVTQIIPIRNVQARQLITDLAPLISSQATIMANDAGNSIIVTDTQANIKHLAQIIQAIDGSAEDVTEVQVFHLQYHDPVEVANMLTSIFADQSQGNGQASPIRFGGFPGFGGGGFRRFFGGGGGPGGFGRGGFGGNNQGAGGNNQSNARPRAHVVAVADQRTQSVLVTAPKDLMGEIEQLVSQIDQQSPKVQRVSVIHLENADPTEVQKVLQQFQANNGRSAQSQQNSVLMQRANQNSSSSGIGGFGGGSGIGNGFGGGGSGFGGGFGGGGGGGFGGGGFRGVGQ